MAVVDTLFDQAVVQSYGQPSQNQVLVRLPMMQGAEQGTALEGDAKRVVDALQKADIALREAGQH